jgi:hypothetical protein
MILILVASPTWYSITNKFSRKDRGPWTEISVENQSVFAKLVGAGFTGLPKMVGQIRNFQIFEIKHSKKIRVHFNIFDQNKIQSNTSYKIWRIEKWY